MVPQVRVANSLIVLPVRDANHDASPSTSAAFPEWWANLYWKREEMSKQDCEKVTCDIMVVEGTK